MYLMGLEVAQLSILIIQLSLMAMMQVITMSSQHSTPTKQVEGVVALLAVVLYIYIRMYLCM